jgi:hypothetical protein
MVSRDGEHTKGRLQGRQFARAWRHVRRRVEQSLRSPRSGQEPASWPSPRQLAPPSDRCMAPSASRQGDPLSDQPEPTEITRPPPGLCAVPPQANQAPTRRRSPAHPPRLRPPVRLPVSRAGSASVSAPVALCPPAPLSAFSVHSVPAEPPFDGAAVRCGHYSSSHWVQSAERCVALRHHGPRCARLHASRAPSEPRPCILPAPSFSERSAAAAIHDL